jgi:hypothetical protein
LRVFHKNRDGGEMLHIGFNQSFLSLTPFFFKNKQFKKRKIIKKNILFLKKVRFNNASLDIK